MGRKPAYKTSESKIWDSSKGGLNSLVAGSKIKDNELQIADNIILVDTGTPIRRYGTAQYGATPTAGGIYGLKAYYKADGTNELLFVNKQVLKKRDSSTGNWTSIGGSFASGALVKAIQYNDTIYLTDGISPLHKYNGTISTFTGITAPANASVVRGLSLASGPITYNYRVTATNNQGETLSVQSNAVYLAESRELWNTDPTILKPDRKMTINWATSTSATGYNIYGVISGQERYVAHVDGQSVNTYTDYGTTPISDFFQYPTTDTTVAPKGKYIIEYKSSLVIAGDTANPSRVYYSAGLDKPESFGISDGGGWVDISKNSDDGFIKGLSKYQNKLVIFKERSIWQFDFNETPVPSIQLVQNGLGCVSDQSIQNVENDVFFAGRKVGMGIAIFVLGYEPNYLNILRTNDLSARVRPDLQSVTQTDKVASAYYQNRYILFYPAGGATENNKAIVYDRERLGFTKWNDIYARLASIYYDSTGAEKFLYLDSSDETVTHMDASYVSDKGTPILWTYKTKDYDFEDSFVNKKFKWVSMRLRDVRGNSTLNIYSDTTNLVYTTNLSSSSPLTSFMSLHFGSGHFRLTAGASTSTTTQLTTVKRIPIQRVGTNAEGRTISLELTGNQTASVAGLLETKLEAIKRTNRQFSREELLNI